MSTDKIWFHDPESSTDDFIIWGDSRITEDELREEINDFSTNMLRKLISDLDFLIQLCEESHCPEAILRSKSTNVLVRDILLCELQFTTSVMCLP